MPHEISPNALSRRVRPREDRLPQVASSRGLIRGPVGGVPPQAKVEPDTLTPKRLLRGLLQHLMTALVLGLVVGAAGAVSAWYLVPAPYEAKALIQVKADTPRLVFATVESRGYDHNYVRTQMQMVTSDVVVRKALTKPGIADVDLFQSVENPRVYLRKNLRATNARSAELVELTLAWIENAHPSPSNEASTSIRPPSPRPHKTLSLLGGAIWRPWSKPPPSKTR